MINIVTVKTGTKYGPEYVNRLGAMVKRHFHAPYKFICVTDDSNGLHPDIEIRDSRAYGLTGWWTKLLLFKDLTWLKGRVLWLDLDTVIVDDITFLKHYDGKLAMLRDVYNPDAHWQSSIMCLKTGEHPEIWDHFIKRPGEIMESFHGDQEWISSVLRSMDKRPEILQDLFPDKFRSYKVHCQNGIPAGTAIVFFHGRPMPHEADASWIQEHWR